MPILQKGPLGAAGAHVKLTETCEKIPDARLWMLLDYDDGRRCEVDAINGASAACSQAETFSNGKLNPPARAGGPS